MINVGPLMDLSNRDRSKPAFTPTRPEIPDEKRVKPPEPPLRRSIIVDGFHPRDLRELNPIFCCEQCSYFDSKQERCAMGFKTEYHRREAQLKMYNLTGKMALCRSQEID